VPRDGRLPALARLVEQRGEHLLRTAVLLAGDRAAGEDLLQDALERMLRSWRHADADPEAYLRRVLYNLAVDRWRRQAVWQRVVRQLPPGNAAFAADASAEVDLRDTLLRLVTQLPARQRAIVVLRYWEELTEAEVAGVLGCSVGTVKSGASRGIARLRELCESSADPGQAPDPASLAPNTEPTTERLA
jgi:RNA polymerase sigma-70 factor (sigma-E family)